MANVLLRFTPDSRQALIEQGEKAETGEFAEILLWKVFMDSYEPGYEVMQKARLVLSRGMEVRQEALLHHYEIMKRNSLTSNFDAEDTAERINA